MVVPGSVLGLGGQTPPSNKVVEWFHGRADTTRPESIHHPLGTGPSEAAAGDHTHNGKDSAYIIPAGTALTMAVGPVGVLHGRVAWRVGPVHGVSFDQSLHPAVLDHILVFLSTEPALIEAKADAA